MYSPRPRRSLLAHRLLGFVGMIYIIIYYTPKRKICQAPISRNEKALSAGLLPPAPCNEGDRPHCHSIIAYQGLAVKGVAALFTDVPESERRRLPARQVGNGYAGILDYTSN